MAAHGELDELRARVAQLEALVERLGGERPAVPSAVRREPEQPTPTSPTSRQSGLDRRRMLRNGFGLSAAAVAGVGMTDALGSAAAADDGDAVTVARTVSPTSAASDPTRITNPSTETHATALLELDNVTDGTVALPDNTKAAVVGVFAGHEGPPVNGVGVLGLSDFNIGVEGRSDGYRGVSGWSLGVGVHGEGVGQGGIGVEGVAGGGTGVSASSTDGRALVATSQTGEAVHATSQDNVAIFGQGSFGVVGNGDALGTGVGAQGLTGVLATGDDVGVDSTSAHGIAVKATSSDGTGVKASAPGNIGVDAEGGYIAVQATGLGAAIALKATSDGPGVIASSVTHPGVHGSSEQDAGVWGESTATGYPGVLGTHVDAGTGVDGLSQTGTGVKGSSTSGPGVEASSATGSAVVASSGAGTQAAVKASHAAAGAAVSATSTSGVGARLKGGAAAVRLVPQAKAGAPTSGRHQRGELLVDSVGKAWLCTADGTPGTWKRLAFA